MSTAFATIAQRLGERTVGALADATLAFGALSVDGVLDDGPVEELGMQARRTQFTCATADLAGVGPVENDAVTVTRNSVAVTYAVALRTDHPLSGQTVLDLLRDT
jgi:hypothetical protein